MQLLDLQDDINIIKQKSQFHIKQFIKDKLYSIQYNIPHQYKNKNKFDYLLALATLIPFINNIQFDIRHDSSVFKLLVMINKCMYGQKILIKYNNFINNIPDKTLVDLINMTSESWTFPIFQYYMSIIKNKNINSVYDRILVDSFSNTDDRIYQEIIQNKEYKLLFDFNNNDNIKNIIYNIFINNNVKNQKYILRRLRYLNMIVPNLIDYSTYIINSCCTRFNTLLFPSILKYYYSRDLTLEEIDFFVEILSTNDNPDINIKQIYIDVYNILKTQNEKNILTISMLLRHGTSYGKKIIDGDLYFNYYENMISTLLLFVLELNKPTDFININEFRNFIDSFSMYNITKCVNIKNYSLKKIMFLLPYFVLSEGSNAKHFNLIRYSITKFIKNIRNKKKMITKLKLYPVLNELKNLKPKCNKPVLSSSYFSSQINQKFNTIPPYHLFPGQLQNIDNNKKYLLKEKADGSLVHSIPKDIYPNPQELLNYKLKVEYIENLDLYLVFDIDINSSIVDRHNYIHGLHKYGQKQIPLINNVEDMIDFVNIERNKLKNFLKEDYDNYRWYPKPAWYIDNITNFVEPFTDLVNMNNSFDKWVINNPLPNYKNETQYYNDGLILTPLDGSREIKIKPKNLYTIDLLYINNKWVDRDNIEWDVKIDNELINELINNTIWRCYYTESGLVAKELRHDKNKPNTNKVAVLINGLYYYEYKYNKYDNIYRDNNIVDSYWTSIVKSNTNIIKKMISTISTFKVNPNIIDFGCGSGRSLLYLNNYIKDYTYIGLDKDINMICKAINKYSINKNIMFAYKDIARSAENNWINLEKNGYDIVLMINSLMHFSTDYFWKELESITKPSSLLLFNLVSMEKDEHYKLTDSDEFFMERKDNTIYYKFPIHNNIKEEPYIDINDILKRGYNIVECYQSKEDNLSKYYKWYILERSTKTN